MSKYGAIQNEEVLQEVLENDGVFFIPCEGKADAHSKAVSLNNARKRLTVAQQKKIRIQRAEVDGEWGVKVMPTTKIVVWKIVDGEKIPWDSEEGKLSDEGQRMMELMVKDGIQLEEIATYLKDEKEDAIKKAYARLTEGVNQE